MLFHFSSQERLWGQGGESYATELLSPQICAAKPHVKVAPERGTYVPRV